MTQAVSEIVSPLLERFKNYRPGDIHEAAAKVHLMTGFANCRMNTIKDAAWNKDKSALIVIFAGDYKTTLIAELGRLITKCNCNQWQPARNCPHVVIAWAVIKKTVSPETLSHIQFNQQMLIDMKNHVGRTHRYVTYEFNAENEAIFGATEEIKPKVPIYRLLIERSGQGNSIRGGIRRGEESIYGWTTQGLPTDLACFLASHRFYDSTQRYLEMFIYTTGGAYPIVFRDSDGVETTLAYKKDQPCTAGITFDIRGRDVLVSRSFDNGVPLPDSAIVHGQLLFDLAACVVMPVVNRDAWLTWETVFKQLDGTEFIIDADTVLDDEYSPVADEYRVGLSLHSNTLTAPLELFNNSAIHLEPEAIKPDARCHFWMNGEPFTKSPPEPQSYMLDIPNGLTDSTVSLMPLSCHGDFTTPFNNEAFWFFKQYRRSSLSGAMRTKKRLKSFIDAAFQLLDERGAKERNSIMRSVTASPDFLKRDVRKEVKELMIYAAESWQQVMNVAIATPDGWRFYKNENASQARLLRILYELFGLDAFVDDLIAIKVRVATDRLIKVLPQLTERLQSEGFSMRIGSEPLAEAEWAFSLDATRSSQDWFELKPEIRCNGELLTEDELRNLLDGSGMLRRDGKLMLLDEISTHILAMFTGAMPSGKKKKKGEQEPVRVPRLQILDWLQLRNHGVQVLLSEDDTRILDSLLNFSSIPARPLPGGIKATLRHYQVDAWHWLAFLYEHRFGACLADDMGLGKTVQGITLLAGIMSGEIATASPPGTPHLVVAPPSLLFNWEAELARFLPEARVMIFSGSGRTTDEFANHDVVITSYGIVQRDCELLADQPFNVIIFDETQMVKNLQAVTTNAVRKLKGKFILALTGTPVENHLGEYFAIMDLCLPGLLGTREEFSRKLSQDGATGAARLIGRTKPFVLRRTKQLIAAELPPKIEMDIPLELNQKQRVFYQRTVEEVRGQVKDAYESHAPAQARIIALTAILRLRQICLAPSLASSGADKASPKLEFLAEQLGELRDEGHSALVFSQFTGYLDIIEKGLREHGFSCLRLDGSTPVPQRKKLVQKFQNSAEPAVFLISLKAGGKGLNLTRATYVYHMDPWWNPAVENQASDRAHRIGQTEQVTITRLIMRHTIEEKMMALKEQKTLLYKAILEDGAGSGGAGLTREDFDFLLQDV